VLESPGLIERGKVNPVVLKPLPVTLAWVIVRTPFPVLVTRMVCEFVEPTVTLPKFALEGVRLIAAWMPVPLTETTVLVPSVLVTVIFPETVSAADGLNATFIVWVWPGASVSGVVTPLVVMSFALTVTCEIVTFALPLLVSVTLLELVIPALTLPKLKLVGFADTATVPATPVPLRATMEGDPAALLEIVTLPGKLPAVVGAKVALKVALPPAAMVLGVANPLML